MKLLETYSRNCSVDILSQPEIVEKFFPFPIDKYITLQSKSGMPAKDYDWFQECIDLLFPILERNKIKIVHIGKDNSPPFRNVIDLRNQTSLGQSCYLIKRAACHLSVDSWSCHYAAAEGVPLVSLYGSTTVENHSPYHTNGKIRLLESHRNGNKASFSREESPKTVNLINPENIVKNVCELLDVEFNYDFETLEIGQNYSNRIIESVPDQVVNIANLQIEALIVRMDYLFNEHNLLGQLHHCKCTIVTDRPIKIEILKGMRPNVVEIIYNLKNDPKPDVSFVKSIFNEKIPYRLITFLNDDEINKYRLDFMDWGIIQLMNSKKPEKFDINEIEKFYYKSNKFLLSDGKIHQSFYDYKNKRPINHLISTPQQLIQSNIEDLWIDSEYNYFLKKIS